MPLRVAACPRCKAGLVFGERICRSCGQTFDYGAAAPPQPSFAQIVEALAAAGLPAPRGAPQPEPPRPSNPFGSELDSGRFEDVGDVEIPDMPGFMDSGIFKMFTPDHVDAAPVFGLDSGRFEEVGAVAPASTPGVEHTATAPVGDVFSAPVSGIFHSDMFHVDVDAPAGRLEGLEASSSAARPAPAKKREPDLGTIMCRCGERHRLPRCPACGTAHPDA